MRLSATILPLIGGMEQMTVQASQLLEAKGPLACGKLPAIRMFSRRALTDASVTAHPIVDGIPILYLVSARVRPLVMCVSVGR